MRNLRKKIWIDRFQTKLVWRIAAFFLFYQMAVWFLVLIERNIFIAMDELLGRDWALFTLSVFGSTVVLVGILFVYEAVKFSHRLVGPLFRFRKMIQAIRDGEEMDLMRLRDGDFLQELKDEFNEMLKVLEQRGAVTIKQLEVNKEEKVAV